MMILILLLVVLLLWIVHRLWTTRRILMFSRRFTNKYLALPIIGHGWMFLGTGEDRMKAVQNLGREAIKNEYGLTNMWLGPQYCVMICDPDIAAVICKATLHKSVLSEQTRHLMGNGSIFAPVHIWRVRRKFLAPTFLPKNLKCFIEVFAEQSAIMVRCLQGRAGKDTFSIWNNVTSYTMDSICQTALGIVMNAQTTAWHPFLAAFDKYCKLGAARVMQPWLHWEPLYRQLPAFREAEKNRKIIHDFVDEVIRKREITIENDDIQDMKTPKVAPGKTTFLDLLLKSCGGANEYSALEIREEMLVLMLAGTDTSAVGASFTIVMLSRFITVQERVYEEIREIFGDSTRSITIEDLSRLKYMDAVIRETLRLYPPVPMIVRQNYEDLKLNSELTLPAGTCSFFNIWGIHRNPRYWGDDAEQFHPDRFLNGKVSPASAYMAFSYGPRNCLGYKYAMMSMMVVVTTLLRHYKVLPSSELSSEDLRKPLRLEFGIMMKDADNFKVRLEPRN